MLAGTALYVRLMVYMGLSLFIIRQAYVYLVVCIFTHITLQYLGVLWEGISLHISNGFGPIQQ